MTSIADLFAGLKREMGDVGVQCDRDGGWGLVGKGRALVRVDAVAAEVARRFEEQQRDIAQFERAAARSIALAGEIAKDDGPLGDKADDIVSALLDIMHGRQGPQWPFDAVLAERDAARKQVEEQRAVIAAMGTALDRLIRVRVPASDECACDVISSGVKCSVCAARDLIADPAHTRVIEEHRAMEERLARVVADEIRRCLTATARSVTSGNTAPERTARLFESLDLDAPIERALDAYRAARGTR